MDEPGKSFSPSDDDNGDFNPLFLLVEAIEIAEALSDEEFNQLQEKIAAEKRMKEAVVNSSTTTEPMFDSASSLNKCKWGGVNGSYPDYDIVSKQERLRKEKALKKPMTENPMPKKVKFFCSNSFTGAEFDIPRKKRSSLSGKLKGYKEEGAEIQCSSFCYNRKATWIDGRSSDEDDAMQQNKKLKMDKPSSSKQKYSSGSQTSSGDSSKSKSKSKSKLESKSKSKKRGGRKSVYTGPEPPPDLPDEFKKKIVEMGGSDVKLVIQKPLYFSDICSNNTRLSIPFRQIREADFLTEEEKDFLNSPTRPPTEKLVGLIDTKLELWPKKLRRWDMEKSDGKVSKQYVLVTKWHDLMVNNKLKEMDVIQLWSFRLGLKLHFALVLVHKAEDSGISEGKST